MKNHSFLIIFLITTFLLSACSPQTDIEYKNKTVYEIIGSALDANSAYIPMFLYNDPVYMVVNEYDYNNKETRQYVKRKGFNEQLTIDYANQHIVLYNSAEDMFDYQNYFVFSHLTQLGDNNTWISYRDTVAVQTSPAFSIIKPDMSIWECTYPYIAADDVYIEWEADTHNTNGVVFVVSWIGTMIGKSTTTEPSPIYTATLVEDNGHILLDEELFSDIPTGAFVTLYMLRANIEQFEVNGSSTKWSKSPMTLFPNIPPRIYTQQIRYAVGSVAYFSFVLTHEIN